MPVVRSPFQGSLVVAALLLVAACTPSPKAPARDDDPRTVSILAPQVKAGRIGTGAPEQGTYVLVDVENTSKADRLVTIEGELTDEAGAKLAALPADEIRVPAGARRTFALVAAAPAPLTARPKLKVANAIAVDYPPQVAIEGFAFTAGAVPVATAVARNTIERDVSCVVAATFYDAERNILGRPFTVVPLPIGQTRQLRFEGPAAATSAVIFVGQIAFH